MSDTEASQSGANLILDYELDAPPDKVWRAISIPELREQWLPEKHLADDTPSRRSRESKSAIGCAKRNRPSLKAS